MPALLRVSVNAHGNRQRKSKEEPEGVQAPVRECYDKTQVGNGSNETINHGQPAEMHGVMY